VCFTARRYHNSETVQTAEQYVCFDRPGLTTLRVNKVTLYNVNNSECRMYSVSLNILPYPNGFLAMIPQRLRILN